MKIIVTTSDGYLHLIPIFVYLFEKYWDKGIKVEVVGYSWDRVQLPDGWEFYTMGWQGPGPGCFGADLRAYFEKQPDRFIWLMEDTFIKRPVDVREVQSCYNSTQNEVGRFNLTNEGMKREHRTLGMGGLYEVSPNAKYRLSTQPSVWNRDFLLQYLTPGLTPWQFETQDSYNDGWRILGPVNSYVKHNEGVSKHDLYDVNLTGMHVEDIDFINKIIETWER